MKIRETSVGFTHTRPNNILGECRTLWGEYEQAVTNCWVYQAVVKVSGHSTQAMACNQTRFVSLLSAKGNLMSQLQKIACHRVVHSHTMETIVQPKYVATLANCRLSLNTGWLVMHNLYLSHLREIPDGDCHTIDIKQNLCHLLHSACP